MISINLLPKNLRKKERKKIVLPYKAYVVWVCVALGFLHVGLFSLAALKGAQNAILRSKWSRMEPQSKDSVALKAEIRQLETGTNSLKDVMNRKVSSTELLSGLNLAMPRGLWLDRLTFSSEGLAIYGTVVSLSHNEMTIIGKFLQDLKSNKLYADVFSKIELSSVQRRTIKTYDVVDFVLTGELKS